ncbi:MAG: hypothetical protein JRN62_03545 [Nitrososphaerota archaeon]|jgi:hypothetical protein|nr:hypothetical protein [Nitrososphaerota archaeon]MDG6948675.1 hypothetical protein [Nitrososphaerota archaeon]
MSQTLTEALAEKIFTALAIAEAEAGEEQEFDDVRAALYGSFPGLKEKHEARAAARRASAEQQQAARKEIASECLEGLANTLPVLPQVMKFFAANYANGNLSRHFSDGICLAADIWRYATPEVIGRLADEVKTKTWLGLADILEDESFTVPRDQKSRTSGAVS